MFTYYTIELRYKVDKNSCCFVKLTCSPAFETSVIQVLRMPVTALLMEKVLKYAYNSFNTWTA
jgi:hypothetical protein